MQPSARLALRLAAASIWLVSAAAAAVERADSGAAAGAFRCERKLARKDLQAALTKVQSRYQSIAAVRAGFSQDSYLAALDTAESSRGRVIFSKPGKMKWSYESPEPQEFVLKDHTVWLYQPEINQVLIDELSEVLLTDLPVSFLMGVGKLSEGFSLKGGCASAAGVVLELDPKQIAGSESKGVQRENSLKSISILVSPEGFPAGVRVFDLVGNVTTIALHGMADSGGVPDSEFSVEYPSGTDVNDRRIKSKG